MTETPGDRLKRLRIRAWRRGTKEMDLILGTYADRNLATLTADELDAFDAILEENDHDLYLWVSGRAAPPEIHAPLIARLQEQPPSGGD